MVNHDQSGLTLLAFLTALRKELQSLSAEAIIERLLKYGETIPQEDRAAFLLRFSASEQDDAMTVDEEYEMDESLAGDIDSFASDIKDQLYVDGRYWDYEVNEMVVEGDESWSDEMEDLFSRVDDAFFAADFSTAASEYPKLFTIFELPFVTGEECFPGESSPIEMVGINIQETVARYLRSLLGNADEWDIDHFISALVAISGQFYKQFLLQAILEASAQPFSRTEQFLRELEPILVEKYKDSAGHAHPDWGALLREAVSLRNGSDGLATLAHEQGTTMPEAYYELILALRRDGRDEEALTATLEALEEVEIPSARGMLANALATLLDERALHEEALQAIQLSWRSYPTLFNLKEYLAHSNPDIPEMLTRLDVEYALVKSADITFSQLKGNGDATHILLQALAGDYDSIISESQIIREFAWTSTNDTACSPYAALLLASLEPATLPPVGSHLAKLVQILEDTATNHGRETIISSTATDRAGVDIPTLLIARLNTLPEHRERQTAYREATRQVAFRAADEIVGKKYLFSYSRAAQIAVAFAEVMMLSGCPAEAIAIPKELTTRFKRHTSFRSELQTAWKTSPVVRDLSW